MSIPSSKVVFAPTPIKLNALTEKFPKDATGFLKKHLVKQLIDLYAESEKTGEEKMMRVCFNYRKVFLEEIKGIASADEGEGAQLHFEPTEDPKTPRKGRFLTLIHTHPPYRNPLKELSPEYGLCALSDDDILVAMIYGGNFHIYPKEGTIRMRGLCFVDKEPKIQDINLGKRKRIK